MKMYYFEVSIYQPVCSKIPTREEYSSRKQLREYTFAEIVAFAELRHLYLPSQSSAVAHEFLPGTLYDEKGYPKRDQIRFYINGEIIASILDISDAKQQSATEDFLPAKENDSQLTEKTLAALGSAGIEAFARERKRQIEQEGFDLQHYMQHSPEELARAAICYAMHPDRRRFEHRPCFRNGAVVEYFYTPSLWPWDISQWKPSSRKRDLEKAGALLAAAYDLKEAQEW